MIYKKIIEQYCELMQKNDVTTAINLFAKNAQITSPTLGTQTPEEFLAFIDNTKRTEIILNELFTSQTNKNRIAACITVNSLWENTKKVQIDAIDVFEFDENNKIKSIKMYYDSHAMREFLDNLKE